MGDKSTRAELHGCIVCGRPYELYVVLDSTGRLMGTKVMTAGGKPVPHPRRVLVACESHPDEAIRNAIERVYGTPESDDD